MRRPLLAVLAVAVLPLVTGCQGASCTHMGAASEVVFENVVNALPDGARYRVRACVDDTCLEWERSRADRPDLTVGLGEVSGPTTVTATLTVTSLASPSEVVFEQNTSVDLTMYQPNGPRCEPTVYQGRAEVTAAGDLVPQPSG